MQKTFASLLITLAVSLLGIAAAYMVGQRSAEYRLRDDVARSEATQRALIEELRRDLAPRPTEVVPVKTASLERVEMNAAESARVDNTPAPPVPADEPAAEPDPENAATAVNLAPIVAQPENNTPVEPETPDPGVSDMPIADAVPASADSEEPPAPPIARESFDAVALGTSYTEVAQKFGREGRASLTMEDASGTQTKQYLWQWVGPAGESGRVDMRFVDGRLTDKSYRE